MPITKNGSNKIIYTEKQDLWDSDLTGVFAGNDFAIAHKNQPLKQVQFDIVSSNEDDAIVTIQLSADSNTTLDLSAVSTGDFTKESVNGSETVSLGAFIENTTTVSASTHITGLSAQAYEIVQAGQTNSNAVYGIELEAGRSGGTDTGTLATVRVLNAQFVHDTAGTTSTVEIVKIVPLVLDGTVTNLYDIRAVAGTNTGTVTNHFGVHIAPAAAGGTKKSWIAQTVLLGGTSFSTPTGACDINDDHLRIRNTKTPSSSSDVGNAGDIAWDADFVYVCIATDTWTRVAIATW